MTLTVELTPEEETVLRTKAGQPGMDEATYVRSLIKAEAVSEPDFAKMTQPR